MPFFVARRGHFSCAGCNIFIPRRKTPHPPPKIHFHPIPSRKSHLFLLKTKNYPIPSRKIPFFLPGFIQASHHSVSKFHLMFIISSFTTSNMDKTSLHPKTSLNTPPFQEKFVHSHKISLKRHSFGDKIYNLKSVYLILTYYHFYKK